MFQCLLVTTLVLILSVSGLNAGENKKAPAVAGHSPRFLWHCGISCFFSDHCRQQRAALDFASEELVISGVSVMYITCIQLSEEPGGGTTVKRNIYYSKRSRLLRDVKTA